MKLSILKDGNSMAGTNTYLIYDVDSKDAWIIDATTETKAFIDTIKKEELNLKYVLLTHGHWDHIMSVDFWREEYGAKIVCHSKCKDYLEDPELNGSYKYSDMPDYSLEADIYLEGNQGQFDIFRYYYTPGHSYDHLIYQLGYDIVFSGDLIFRETVGRTDMPGSNHQDLVQSIKNIIYKEFNDDTSLLPGHGQITSVGHEKRNNLFVLFEE